MHTKHKNGFLGALFVYLILLNYFILVNPPKIFTIDESITPLTNVYRVLSDAQSPDQISNQVWKPVSLPDIWYETHEKQGREYWYKTEVNITAIQPGIWAIYVPSVTHNLSVYINNIWVGQAGKFSDPVSRHHNQPLYYEFSSELMNAGKNDIQLHVKSEYFAQGLLGEVYLNKASALKKTYQLKHSLRFGLIEVMINALFFLAFIILCFWMARPKDTFYFIFFLEVIFWSIHNLNLFVHDIPLSGVVWESLMMATFGWTVVAMIFFNHSFVGGGSRIVEKFTLVFATTAFGFFLLPDIEVLHLIGFRVWDLFLVVFGCYAIVHLLNRYYRYPSNDIYLMLIVGLPILVCGLHDILFINHLADPLDGLIMHYSIIPSSVLFAWFLLKRFLESVNQAEELSRNLEDKVNLKEEELKQQYDKLLKLEQDQVLSKERERIMRDMHDGIGGQLVSVIATLQDNSGEIFDCVRIKVQNSLTDLRLVIDSLDPALQDLSILLGIMRARIQDQLSSAGIKMIWEVDDIPELMMLTPGYSLHVMRIIQEATTNVIKHSQASKLVLSMNENKSERRIYINISDNGIGFENKGTKGRGMNNMSYRAEKINAELLVDSGPSGTILSLVIIY